MNAPTESQTPHWGTASYCAVCGAPYRPGARFFALREAGTDLALCSPRCLETFRQRPMHFVKQALLVGFYGHHRREHPDEPSVPESGAGASQPAVGLDNDNRAPQERLRKDPS